MDKELFSVYQNKNDTKKQIKSKEDIKEDVKVVLRWLDGLGENFEWKEEKLQKDRFSFLEKLKKIKKAPKFNVKKGWQEFQKYYLLIAEELMEELKKEEDKK